jgi:transposase InsO family protein
VRDMLGRDLVTERRACRVLGQARNTQRRKASVADDEPQLVKRIVWMASEYGRYGYRRITALLRAEGWWVNHKRVEQIWRQEGLKVPAKQPKRRRLWLGDGSCIRLRPTHRKHVWSYDFVMDRTADGRVIRMLTIVDEFTRECLAIDVAELMRREPKMGAPLPRDGIAVGLEQPGQTRPGHTPRQPRAHGARISSRTMCRRITLGACPSSK